MSMNDYEIEKFNCLKDIRIPMILIERNTFDEKLFNSSWEMIYDSTMKLMGDFMIKHEDGDNFGTILCSVEQLFYDSFSHMLNVKKVIDEKSLFEIINDCVDLFYDGVNEFSDKYTLLLKKEDGIYQRSEMN